MASNEAKAYHAAFPEPSLGDFMYANVSGVEDEPLWVSPSEVAAIGVRGKNDTLLVLRSGTQLVAKGMHPNEVVQLLASLCPGGTDAVYQD